MAKEIIIDTKPQDNHELGIENIRAYLQKEVTKIELMMYLHISLYDRDKWTQDELVSETIRRVENGELKWSDLDDQFDFENVRICTECGQPMVVGVFADGRYYCSDECLDKGIGIEKYLELADPDDDDSTYYYTEWD